MKLTAAVYRQLKPEITKPIRYYIADDGSRFPEHVIRLVHITDITGTYDEIWERAKELVPHPVLEFPRSMYKEFRNEQF